MYVELENGLKIRYDEYGKDKQKHILFIHGLGSSSIVWRDICLLILKNHSNSLVRYWGPNFFLHQEKIKRYIERYTLV